MYFLDLMYPPISPHMAPLRIPNSVYTIMRMNEPPNRLPKKKDMAPVTAAFLVPSIIFSDR